MSTTINVERDPGPRYTAVRFHMNLSFASKFLCICFVLLFPVIGVAHYCPAMDQNERKALNAAMKAIEIERIELPYSVDYRFKALDSAGGENVYAVYFRFGFDAHPEGAVLIKYENNKVNQIIFHVDSISKGFRGCIDIVYGKECGIMPQIVVTYERAYINKNIRNTVYCGFDPNTMKPNE